MSNISISIGYQRAG